MTIVLTNEYKPQNVNTQFPVVFLKRDVRKRFPQKSSVLAKYIYDY